MKKIILIATVIILMMATASYALTTTRRVKTLLNGVTATGAEASQVVTDYDYPISQYTCLVLWGGTTPTNTVVSLDGSIDGTNFDSLATVTVTSSPYLFHVVNKPVLYIRGNYVSKSGGDTTTSVSMTCLIGVN